MIWRIKIQVFCLFAQILNWLFIYFQIPACFLGRVVFDKRQVYVPAKLAQGDVGHLEVWRDDGEVDELEEGPGFQTIDICVHELLADFVSCFIHRLALQLAYNRIKT